MIIKRNDKNSPLTHEELDENFRELRYDTDLQKITDNGNTTNLSFTVDTIIANVINSNSYITGSNTYTIVKNKLSTTQTSEDVISLASGNSLTYVIASNNYTNFWGDPSKAQIPFLKINYDSLIINYEHDWVFASGIFNLQEHSDQIEYTKLTIDNMMNHANVGVAFNLLTADLSPLPELERSRWIQHDPGFWLNYLIEK